MLSESTLSSFSEISNKLHETRVLKQRQNRECESSLEADRKQVEKRMEYLDNLKVYRQSKLKTKPYITEDSVLVSVLHTAAIFLLR